MEDKPKREMESATVADIYFVLEKGGVKIWVDGGWAVDALLGRQTRSHSDLDIAIEYRNLPTLREYLESQGYKDVPRDDDKKWNFVMGDDKGHEVDVHAFTFDENGHVVEGIEYPDESLSGTGTVDGRTVRCISAEYMVKFISPWLYKLRNKDFQDVAALCEKFGIPYPKEYVRFVRELPRE